MSFNAGQEPGDPDPTAQLLRKSIVSLIILGIARASPMMVSAVLAEEDQLKGRKRGPPPIASASTTSRRRVMPSQAPPTSPPRSEEEDVAVTSRWESKPHLPETANHDEFLETKGNKYAKAMELLVS